jgi:serine/threonine protein kinase
MRQSNALEERAPQQDAFDGQCLAEDVLHALASGTLEPVERSLALSHLDECELCQALLADEVRCLPEFTYRVKRFIARGGMGEVYEAWDVLLSERVALKTINPVAASADQVRASARFKQEVQLSRRVADPHVCRIFEFGHHTVPGFGPLAYLTMEFIEGQTLGARLRKGPRLPLEEVVELSRQMLRGLAAAHSVGVLHRDLKSENVMLRSNAAGSNATGSNAASFKTGNPGVLQAVIMDFGLARLLGDQAHLLTERHELVGSAAYMAPEQLEEGSALSRATDIYAFGIVLFEMLTGRLPFDGRSAVAIAMRRLTQKAPAPSSLVPELPAAWDELVLHCLERDVSRRFASSEEVAAALEALAHPSAVVARRPQRRRGLLLVGSAVAAAALVGVALYAAVQHRLAGVQLPPRAEVTTALTPPAVTPQAVTPTVEPAAAPPVAAPSVMEAAVPAQDTATEALAPARAEQRPVRAHPRPAAPPAAPEPAPPPAARTEEDVRDVFFLDGPRPPQNSKE